MPERKIDFEHHEELRELLVGRRITSISGSGDASLHLDDGTVLEIIPNDGCGGCHLGNYWMNELRAVPVNMITAVEFEDEDCDMPNGDGTGTVHRIFVFAEEQKIKLLEVEGGGDNGYYGMGYWVTVRTPGPDEPTQMTVFDLVTRLEQGPYIDQYIVEFEVPRGGDYSGVTLEEFTVEVDHERRRVTLR